MRIELCRLDANGDPNPIAHIHLSFCPRVNEEVVGVFPGQGGVVRWRVIHVQHMNQLPPRLWVEPWEA